MSDGARSFDSRRLRARFLAILSYFSSPLLVRSTAAAEEDVLRGEPRGAHASEAPSRAEEDPLLLEPTFKLPTSEQARSPAEFKHINKRRKRN